MRARPV